MLTNCSEFTVKVLEQSQGFLTALITKRTNSKSVWVRLNHLWIDRYLLKVIKDETRTKLETFAKPKKVKSEQYQWRQLFSRVLPTFHLLFSLCLCLTLSWRRPLSYRNQSTDLLRKSVDWFLYENGPRHERVNEALPGFVCCRHVKYIFVCFYPIQFIFTWNGNWFIFIPLSIPSFLEKIAWFLNSRNV